MRMKIFLLVAVCLSFWTNSTTGPTSFPHHKLGADDQNQQKLEGENARFSYFTSGLSVGRKLKTALNLTASSYPKDLFSIVQMRNGAITLHIIGMIYMFIALAVVCDEFFVPTLIVITNKFGIAEDVSGGTFMAAGGSAPELFTSILGIFVSKNDVGIGTIVGSAVFNLLFVTGTCVVLSKEDLPLQWWPLFRDVSFYSLCLSFLIGFFSDGRIEWWEALVLFLCYVAYISFMKFNSRIEVRFKDFLTRCKRSRNKIGNSHVLCSRKRLKPTVDTRQVRFMQKQQDRGVTQLIIQTTDIMTEVYGEPTKLHDGRPLSVSSDSSSSGANGTDLHPGTDNNTRIWVSLPLEETGNPLDISWPDTLSQRITYILLSPIIFSLYMTLPDVRLHTQRKFFPWTFVGSILWIAGFSYCLVWWAKQAGNAVQIPDTVMGLTVLAAGASIPDLITSVIVVRKGFGDMALSSSIGSNIFDITVGLPLPWLIYSAINSGSAYTVTNNGLLCSILLLFLILLALVIGIAVSDWKPRRTLGVSMLFMYLIFATLSVLLEHGIIVCPSI